jgi:hypothetical protein
VEDVKNFPSPTNPSKIREFIGLVGSYRQFVQDFNKIAEPMIRLTKKKVEFIWAEEQEEAFRKLIELLTKAPILVHYDSTKPVRVVTDASKVGAGAVLLQLMDDKIWHPVAYGSWLFNSAQSSGQWMQFKDSSNAVQGQLMQFRAVGQFRTAFKLEKALKLDKRSLFGLLYCCLKHLYCCFKHCTVKVLLSQALYCCFKHCTTDYRTNWMPLQTGSKKG